MQQLRDLHGVGGGALAQVVGHDPQVQRALVAGVAADTPHEHAVAAGGVDRQRVGAAAGSSSTVTPGAAASSSRARSGERLACLHVDRLGVAVHDRHAHAGGADPDRGVVEDLARLVDELELLVGVVVAGREGAGVREGVERDLVGVGAGRIDRALVQQRVGLIEQLVDRRLPVPETA